MDDKIIMNTVLTLTKNMVDIMMHGAIESSNKKIKDTFMKNLNDYITLQGSIYTSMEDAGLYQNETIPESKIIAAASKYETTLN